MKGIPTIPNGGKVSDEDQRNPVLFGLLKEALCHEDNNCLIISLLDCILMMNQRKGKGYTLDVFQSIFLEGLLAKKREIMGYRRFFDTSQGSYEESKRVFMLLQSVGEHLGVKIVIHAPHVRPDPIVFNKGLPETFVIVNRPGHFEAALIQDHQ